MSGRVDIRLLVFSSSAVLTPQLKRKQRHVEETSKTAGRREARKNRALRKRAKGRKEGEEGKNPTGRPLRRTRVH